ncbi:MAG: sulfatase-like hydrolase/transferase [Promethearchaeota archaeon]
MNVIWIVADTFRRDHLGCYGNEWIRTPALDSFAAQSLRFDRHYSGSFPTMPNRADFFTGRLSGIFMRWQPLARELNLLPSILRRNRWISHLY